MREPISRPYRIWHHQLWNMRRWLLRSELSLTNSSDLGGAIAHTRKTPNKGVVCLKCLIGSVLIFHYNRFSERRDRALSCRQQKQSANSESLTNLLQDESSRLEIRCWGQSLPTVPRIFIVAINEHEWSINEQDLKTPPSHGYYHQSSNLLQNQLSFVLKS